MSDNLAKFIVSLGIMWKGMLGIFVVILLITLLVMFIQRLERKFPEKSSDKE
ncbi:MAG: DUF3149 domain-containing protein [Lachnoclostridium sp.]|jgi:4-amino-4-deoxy-L-arabinose transferase-like glycosyltransferase